MADLQRLPDEYLYVLAKSYGLDFALPQDLQGKFDNMDPVKLNTMATEMANPQFWKTYDMEATGKFVAGTQTPVSNKLSSDKLNELYSKYQQAGGKGQLWGKSGYDNNGNFVGQNAAENARANKIAGMTGVSGGVGGGNENSPNPYLREMARAQADAMSSQMYLDYHEQALKDPKLSGYKLNDPEFYKKRVKENAEKLKELKTKADEWESTATEEEKNAPWKDGYGLMRNKDGYLPGQDVNDPVQLRNIFGWGEGGMHQDKMPTPEDIAYFKQTGQNPFTRPEDFQIDPGMFRKYSDKQKEYQTQLNKAQQDYDKWVNLDETSKNQWMNSQEEIANNPWAVYGIKKYQTVDRYTENLNRLKSGMEARQNEYNTFMSQYGDKLNENIVSAPGSIQPRNPIANMSFADWLNSDTGGKAAGYTGGYTSDNFLWMQQNPNDPQVKASNANKQAQMQANADAQGQSLWTMGNLWGGKADGWVNNGSNSVYYGSNAPIQLNSLNSLFQPANQTNNSSNLFSNNNGNKFV